MGIAPFIAPFIDGFSPFFDGLLVGFEGRNGDENFTV
jgi:hypothetical protein